MGHGQFHRGSFFKNFVITLASSYMDRFSLNFIRMFNMTISSFDHSWAKVKFTVPFFQKTFVIALVPSLLADFDLNLYKC